MNVIKEFGYRVLEGALVIGVLVSIPLILQSGMLAVFMH